MSRSMVLPWCIHSCQNCQKKQFVSYMASIGDILLLLTNVNLKSLFLITFFQKKKTYSWAEIRNYSCTQSFYHYGCFSDLKSSLHNQFRRIFRFHTFMPDCLSVRCNQVDVIWIDIAKHDYLLNSVCEGMTKCPIRHTNILFEFLGFSDEVAISSYLSCSLILAKSKYQRSVLCTPFYGMKEHLC